MGALRVELIGLRLPLIEGEADLAKLIVEGAAEAGVGLKDGDVVVVTSKLVLKARGLMCKLSEVRPSLRARIIHLVTGKDPVETELVLRNSRRVLFAFPLSPLEADFKAVSRHPEEAREAFRREPAFLFVEMPNGLIASEAGVDFSNLPPGYAITSNHDFDELARELRGEIKRLSGVDVAVIIADTEVFLSNGKVGSIDVAVGCSGIEPLSREFGRRDLYGRPKFGGLDLVVDEACAAAALLMKQSDEGVPVVIIRGLKYERSERGVRDVLVTRRRGRARSILLRALLLNLLLKLLRVI